MHVIDLEGNEYSLQCTSTNDGEVNGNQSFSATVLPTKTNKLFIDEIDKLWNVVDHDDVEHKIIYAKKQGVGNEKAVVPAYKEVLDYVLRGNMLEGTKDAFADFDSDNDGSSWGDFRPYNDVDITQGETYTAQVYLKVNENNNRKACIMVRMKGSKYIYFRGNYLKAGEEGYSVVTFTVPNGWDKAEVNVVRFDKNRNGYSDKLKYKKAKFEKGDTATPYTDKQTDENVYKTVQTTKEIGLSKVEIKAIPLFFDVLDNKRIYERYDEHMTAQLAFSRIFEDTEFTFVLNGSFSAVQWEGFGDGETRLETFKRAIKRYKCEFRIVGKTVYLEIQIGNDTQQQYRHRLNASNIVQEVDANEMWTLAYGFGDYGNGEGEEDWEDAKLISYYASPLAEILGKREAPPIKNGNITTKTEMDKQLKTLVDESLKVSVTADIHDLRKQGYPIAQSNLGDRVFLIDERIGLDDEVRIVNKSITRNWKGDVLDVKLTFGSEGITKRHQGKLDTARKNITDLLEGKIQLPYNVLDDAVKNATKALKDAQTQLEFTDNGILAIDKNNPNLVTLFNSAGIGVSEDGGATFGQALTGLGLNVDYVYAGSMLADYIAGGILAALNGNTVFNLNDGKLTMVNTEFELGGGANIEFTSSGNKLYYDRNNRKAGITVGTSINDEYPYVAMGATDLGEPLNANDESGFSGFLANTNKRETVDGIQNSVVGKRFHVRDKAVSFSKGFLFKTDSDAYFSPMNTGSHNYDSGRPNNRWENIYLKNNPKVSSDRKLKTDITNVDLEFAKEFLLIDSKRYKMKLTNADLNDGVKGSNPYQYGFVAQDVEALLEGNDMRFESLVTTGSDGSKSMQYGQIHAIHHVLIKNLFNRLEMLENGK